MKSLVTGGAGFIGSNLVKELVKQGDEVTVLDDFSIGKIENLSECIDDIEIIEGDVCDEGLIQKTVPKNDRAFHLVAQCLMVCNSDPTIATDVNLGGTFNLCYAACKSHKKLIYISSSEVYGSCQISPMSESHPTEPQSIYGLSKLMSEQYVRFFNKYYGLRSVIIRPFNTYGPNHRNDQYAAVITAFIKRLEAGEPLIIEGDGTQSRDFTYVSDTVDGILLLSSLENGEIVNVGNGYATTINDLASTLLKIYGKEENKNIVFTKPRINNVHKLESDIKRANSYGYKPKVSLEEGLIKYISWIKKEGL